VTGLRLRPATTDDLQRVIGWLRDERDLAMWSGPTFSWPVTLDDVQRQLDRDCDHGAVWVRAAVDAAGRLIGLARVRLETPERGRYGWVIVDPSLRGRGTGAELVHRTLAAATAELALPELTLWVMTQNVGARRLYQREGFVANGRQVNLSVAGESWQAVELTRTRADLKTAEAEFSDPRLAAAYDPLDPDRSDLEAYRAMAKAFGARSVLDIGCGTGTFACLLAGDGLQVTGVDPAEASLNVARSKPEAALVHWVSGPASAALPLQVDLVTMTANVAQVFVADEAWREVLRVAHAALRSGGRLVFETRVPERRAWQQWTPENSHWQGEVEGVGPLTTSNELIDVFEQWVTFRWTMRFHSDDAELTSLSTLRFRGEAELRATLHEAGFVVDEVRDAPDRPGLEWVFVARRVDL